MQDFKLRPGMLELVAGMAVSGVEGVWGSGARPEHPDDARKKRNLAKGVKAEAEGARAVIEVDVVMEYGRDFIALARETQGAVARAVETMTGWDVAAVDVNVVGVSAL